MPDFKGVYKFVEYVNAYNTKDEEEDEATLNNLVDPNYADIKAIKQDNALRKFAQKTSYDKARVANIYKSAKHLGLLEQRDETNSTHAQGVVIVVTEKGKEYIHKSKGIKLKTGKWHFVVQYFAPWSLVLSIIAIVVSIVSLYIVWGKN